MTGPGGGRRPLDAGRRGPRRRAATGRRGSPRPGPEPPRSRAWRDGRSDGSGSRHHSHVGGWTAVSRPGCTAGAEADVVFATMSPFESARSAAATGARARTALGGRPPRPVGARRDDGLSDSCAPPARAAADAPCAGLRRRDRHEHHEAAARLIETFPELRRKLVVTIPNGFDPTDFAEESRTAIRRCFSDRPHRLPPHRDGRAPGPRAPPARRRRPRRRRRHALASSICSKPSVGSAGCARSSAAGSKCTSPGWCRTRTGLAGRSERTAARLPLAPRNRRADAVGRPALPADAGPATRHACDDRSREDVRVPCYGAPASSPRCRTATCATSSLRQATR